MTAKTLMIQGTTSDAGKSTLVTGLCRVLYRRGARVAPFKPQNMALNSAVTVNNGEIGRAQAVQSLACGIEPHTDMNPVLLKPNSETGSQVIIQGQAIGNMSARDFHAYKAVAMEAVLDSYKRLQSQYDIILVEGAGSPAEINLRENDIANMGFAEAVDCPVILVADIERGGVFAHLAGTLALLSPSERKRVTGMVINRFRGDYDILKPGVDWLENHVQKPVLGVLPYAHKLYIEAEDSLNQNNSVAVSEEHIRIVVPALPRMSNHTDFDALRLHPQIDFKFIREGEDISASDVIILPGSKSVASDLHWLEKTGWTQAINRHLRYAGKLMGICGGYQMLGKELHDPQGVEGAKQSHCGLGLLDIVTTLQEQKTLSRVTGRLMPSQGEISGYEIHVGETTGSALQRPFLKLHDRYDGAISQDQQVVGTYVHGLFDSDAALQWLFDWVEFKNTPVENFQQQREQGINRIADIVEEYLDMDKINEMLNM